MVKERVLLIINPVSGKQKSRYLLFSIVDFLSRSGRESTVFTTTSQGNATELVQKYATKHDRIICCGGDGTLNEIFTGLASMDVPIPVGYIPTGTTNDLAHALGLNSDVRQAIYLSLHGEERDLDLGTFNDDKYFSYVASFGAFSKVAYETPQWLKNRLGRVSYFFYGISEITDIRSRRVRVIADGVEVEGDFVYGSVSNSTVIGGLVKLPEGSIRLDDGKFEVMLIRTPKDPLDLGNIVQGLVNQDYNEEHLLFFTASHVVFSFGEDVPWTVDGEYAGESSSVVIGNMQRKVRILV